MLAVRHGVGLIDLIDCTGRIRLTEAACEILGCGCQTETGRLNHNGFDACAHLIDGVVISAVSVTPEFRGQGTVRRDRLQGRDTRQHCAVRCAACLGISGRLTLGDCILLKGEAVCRSSVRCTDGHRRVIELEIVDLCAEIIVIIERMTDTAVCVRGEQSLTEEACACRRKIICALTGQRKLFAVEVILRTARCIDRCEIVPVRIRRSAQREDRTVIAVVRGRSLACKHTRTECGLIVQVDGDVRRIVAVCIACAERHAGELEDSRIACCGRIEFHPHFDCKAFFAAGFEQLRKLEPAGTECAAAKRQDI